MSGGTQQNEGKSFFSSFTSIFASKPNTLAPDKQMEEMKASPRTGDGAQSTAPRAENTAQSTIPRAENTTHSTTSRAEDGSQSTTPRAGDSTPLVAVHALADTCAIPVTHEDNPEHAERINDGNTPAHEVVKRADSLGSLDQQRSDELEKAIAAAEAKTAERIEQIKSEKKGEDQKEKEKDKVAQEQEAKDWLTKTRENIKYTFISKETEEAFGEILILFDKMFDDFPYNKVDLMFGLMMLDDYYKNAPVLSSARVEDIEFIETVRFYMKFAYCCYGWKFVYGILNRKPNKFLSSMVGVDANIKAIFACTGVEPKDIVVSKFTSSVFDPGHYICLCHERKTIVLAFRGTFHVRDALTDLVASNTPFMQGSAHTGLLRTANNKFRILAPILLKLYEENPTYKLIVVGHSLGAGTASLFSLIFHEAHPEVPMHCYAYAPPGVVSPDLALSSSTAELIDSIVVGNDIVPRLSFATITHLKKIIIQILASGNNTFQRAFQWMAGGMGDGMKQMLKITEAAKIEPSPVPLSDVTVFPPGRLILLVPHTLSEVVEEEGDEESGSASNSDSEIEREVGERKGKGKGKEKEEGREIEKEKEKAKEKKTKEMEMELMGLRQGREKEKENEGKERSRSSSPSPSPLSSSPPSSLSSTPLLPSSSLSPPPSSLSSALPPSSSTLPPSSSIPLTSTTLVSSTSTSTITITSHSSTTLVLPPLPSSTLPPPSSPRSSSPRTPSTPPPTITLPPPSPRTSSPRSSFPRTPSSSSIPSSTPPPTATLPPPSSFARLRRLSESFSPSKIFAKTPEQPKKAKPPKPKTVYLMEYSNSALFNEIIISPSMFTSHMPSAYDKALDSCLQTMQQLKTRTTMPNIVVKMDHVKME